MKDKICLICGKDINKEDYPNINDHQFSRRKYCSDECLKTSMKNRSKKIYYLGFSKETEHNQILMELQKKIGGEIVHPQNNPEHTNPDLIKEDVFIELELMNHSIKFERKIKFLPENKKYILYIKVSKRLKDIFDEIYFLD